jgi:hypothetical protein
MAVPERGSADSQASESTFDEIDARLAPLLSL